MKRVVPKVNISASKLLTLNELSKEKNLPISRTANGFKTWVERGVRIHPHDVTVHLPHIRLGRNIYTSLVALTAFLDSLQDYSHAATAKLADSGLQPVMGIHGDLYELRGKRPKS